MLTTSRLAASSFRELKKLAQDFYFNTWRGHEKPAPAFQGEIVRATRRGWIYITGKSTTGDVKRRLALLPLAKEIIEKVNTVHDFRHERALHHNEGKTLIVETRFWSLIAETKYGKVKVIVEEMCNDGKPQGKHFLSVFAIEE
jgi:hypothetical protein